MDFDPNAEMTTPTAMYLIQHLSLDDPYERSLCVDGEAEDGEITFDALMAEGVATPPPPLPTEFDTLTLGYTSGTTGRPTQAHLSSQPQ